MTITGLIDENEILIEVVQFLRNSDILSTATRGATTATQNFNGNGVLQNFTLTNPNVLNVRSVTVDNVLLRYGFDYSVNFTTGVISVDVAPSVGTNNVVIVYDYGNTDKILFEYDQNVQSIDGYPAIRVNFTSSNTQDGSTDGNVNFSTHLISIYLFAKKRMGIFSYTKDLREKILENSKGFYTLRYLKPAAKGPILSTPNTAEKVFYRTIECIAPLNEEIIN